MCYLKKAALLMSLLLISYEATADFLLAKDTNAIYSIHIKSQNDKPLLVDAKASFGQFNEANECEYTKLINIGEITAGTNYSLTNAKIKQYAGNGYTCGKLTLFSHKQLQEKTFTLNWDGKNYMSADPSRDIITLY